MENLIIPNAFLYLTFLIVLLACAVPASARDWPVDHPVTDFERDEVEAGDASDAFVTRTGLPTDGTLDGRTLMVDLGGLLVQSFRIKTVETKGGETWIYSHDEPGMTVHPGLVKLEYFPNWGIKGEARFKIAGSACIQAGESGP